MCIMHTAESRGLIARKAGFSAVDCHNAVSSVAGWTPRWVFVDPRSVEQSSYASVCRRSAETLEIWSPSALTPEIFHDVFDACNDTSIVHATGLDDVNDEFRKLAP